ncbi:MAG TPA: hypothetical protein PK539_00895 [Candidatus Paceibacterota bacterium]|nr:hypothetical protein [Candidatus Paceibacterota bacterium]
MNKQKQWMPEKELTTAWTIVWVLVAFFFGLFLMYLAHLTDSPKNPHWYSALMREGGAVISTSSVLAAFWDLLLKRRLTRELLSHVGVSLAIKEAGLVSISSVDDFQGEIDWDVLFESGGPYRFFFGYASSWRHSREQSFVKLAKTPGADVKFLLPNPEDETLMGQLANMYATDPGSVKERVAGAIRDIKQIFQDGTAHLSVDVVSVAPSLPFYRFKDIALFSLPKYNSGRGGIIVVTFKKGGFLWHFLEKQIRTLEEGSQPT